MERFFVFSVGESLFALPPEAIREIVTDLDVFPLPACPPYVSGPHQLPRHASHASSTSGSFESERQQATKFLILNVENDDIALGCTEVVEIARAALLGTSPPSPRRTRSPAFAQR